jgi:ABC-2 type transport system ATP-binding protein
MIISIQSLDKIYDKKQVLFDINLSFDPGMVYGIVGRNGAGKTTLFKCLAGLESYTGTIESSLQPLKNHIGYLPTDLFFFSKITGREYLTLILNAREQAIPDLDVKNIFDLPLDQYASTYSTGMKKKLALTANLIIPNEVFILDEPFNGVDIQSNIIINEIIHRLRSLGKTLIISSHIFGTLRDTCDRIHLLDDGRIIKSVDRDGFDLLEHELKDVMVDDRIDRLGLS